MTATTTDVFGAIAESRRREIIGLLNESHAKINYQITKS
jgi:hypothetical protein